MNKRIKELAKQAVVTKIRKQHVNGGLPPREYESKEFDKEKFAELIVRECIDKIETYRIPVGNSCSGELAFEWTYDALKEIRDDIKETFGVE